LPEGTTDDVLDLVAGAIEECGVMHWYGLAVGACGTLQRAEDALLDVNAPDSEPSADDLIAAASRVNAAVASYHARLEILLTLLQQHPSHSQNPPAGNSLSAAASYRPTPAPTHFLPAGPVRHPPSGAPRGTGR
jgi:hypothetical protein